MYGFIEEDPQTTLSCFDCGEVAHIEYLCSQETRGWLETLEEEAYERSLGVVSFEDAFHEARYGRIGGERLG